jgi:hypothetical protein
VEDLSVAGRLERRFLRLNREVPEMKAGLFGTYLRVAVPLALVLLLAASFGWLRGS